MRAVERVDRFRGDAAVRTWIAGIVVRCAWERRRLRARETRLDEPAREPATAAAPADPTDLGRAIARLPPGCREVLVLHDLEGYTHLEIAALLGIGDGTSKSQLHRARRLVRSWFSTQEEAQ
jgi:RNA polymerase sigma-70 factor (ECF subfamily)